MSNTINTHQHLRSEAVPWGLQIMLSQLLVMLP